MGAGTESIVALLYDKEVRSQATVNSSSCASLWA